MGLVEGLELEVAGAAKDWRDLIRLYIKKIAIVEVVVLETPEDGDSAVADRSDRWDRPLNERALMYYDLPV